MLTRTGAGDAKQVWLRDGRSYVPSGLELLRLHELSDAVADAYVAANDGLHVPPVGEAYGDGISMLCPFKFIGIGVTTNCGNNCCCFPAQDKSKPMV